MSTGALTVADAPRLAGPDGWRSVVVHGVLWGVVVSLLESFAIPLRIGDAEVFGHLMLRIAPGWCVVGIAICAWVRYAGPRLERPAFLAASVAVAAVVLSALWSALYAFLPVPASAAGMAALFPNGADRFASFAYQAWVVAFYGGLYMFAWALNRRAERTRHLLAQAGIARVRTETLLGEARLHALRGHVDPQFLLRVMTEVERRYASDPVGADQLIGRLVAFLRIAMPGVRSGRATLASELALLRAYGALCADLEPRRMPWSVAAPEATPDVAFPSLLLVTLLDHLAAACPPGSAGRVDVACSGDEVAVRFDDGGAARDGWLPSELAYRMRVGLSTLYGSAWSLVPRESGGANQPALALRVRPEPSGKAAVAARPRAQDAHAWEANHGP